MKSRFLALLQLISGILLMVFNLGVWINGMIIHIERGMDSALTLFFIVPGAFLLLGWYKNTRSVPPAKYQKWKFILNVLSVNYAVLYILYIASDMIYHESIDLLGVPGFILPLLLALFLTGLILSWKYELYAGIVFLLWYSLVLFGSFRYWEIMHRGPHMIYGIVILVQGILFLVYFFRIKPAKQEVNKS